MQSPRPRTPRPRSPRPRPAFFPTGPWAIGVSGGADSVALLRLLHGRPELDLHVVHLNHQLRGTESDADATFVANLAGELHLPVTIARADEVAMTSPPPMRNIEARGRFLRRAVFAKITREQKLLGVLLAHHRCDQAETVFLRLARGAGVWGLTGMSADAVVGGLRVARPILDCEPRELREWLTAIGQPWREDSSNTSPRFARNRARKLLADRPALVDALVDLARSSRRLRERVAKLAPELPETFDGRLLADGPRLIARWSALRWLMARGAPPAELSTTVLDRFIEQCTDAASTAAQDYPGDIRVRRLRGRVGVGSLALP